MAKIIISTLFDSENKRFFHNLTAGQLETILGGIYPYNFHIVNTTDTVTIGSPGGDNTYEAVNHSVSYHDNKINTVDYSRTIYNNFV